MQDFPTSSEALRQLIREELEAHEARKATIAFEAPLSAGHVIARFDDTGNAPPRTQKPVGWGA